MKINKVNISAAFRNTLPIIFAYLFLGITFGLLLNQAGYSWIWAFLISFFLYAGSMQFVLISLLTGGTPLIQVAVMTFLVNSRHLFYGLSLVEKYEGMGRFKPYMVHALSDETYSLLTGVKIREGEDEKTVMFLIAVFDQFYWILGSVIGGLIGSSLPFDLPGIDFSMTALFTVIFVEQWLGTKDHFPAILGLLTSVIFLVLLGPEKFIFPSLLTAVIILVLVKSKKEVA